MMSSSRLLNSLLLAYSYYYLHCCKISLQYNVIAISLQNKIQHFQPFSVEKYSSNETLKAFYAALMLQMLQILLHIIAK